MYFTLKLSTFRSRSSTKTVMRKPNWIPGRTSMELGTLIVAIQLGYGKERMELVVQLSIVPHAFLTLSRQSPFIQTKSLENAPQPSGCYEQIQMSVQDVIVHNPSLVLGYAISVLQWEKRVF